MSSNSPGHGPFLEVDEDRIAWIVFDDPERSLNVLTESVLGTFDGLIDEVGEGVEQGRIGALVLMSGKAGSFIAGADVSAIEEIEDPIEGKAGARAGQVILHRISRLPIPTIAAIDGVCLGGGTEMSLACRHRIASDDPRTKLGLPEVQLGILPAWGGTTRLPRLIGLQAALDLLLTGKTIDATRARRRGLVDVVFPASLFRSKAREFALARLRGDPPPSPPRRSPATRFLDHTSLGRRIVLSQARKRVLAQTGGHYPAPLKILDVVRASASRTVEAGLELEAEAAGELIASHVSKNLLHVFRLREAARKGRDLELRSNATPVTALGIVGAGVMGGGIAQLAAYNGVRVRIKDIRHEAVQGALKHAESLFRRSVDRRKLDRRGAAQRMELIAGGLDYAGFGTVELVIEAVVERMDVKKAVLGEIEQHVSPNTVLCSNTSSLSIDEMAGDLDRPHQLAGMHFFNPVHRMPLVEVVRGGQTSDEAVATVYQLALDMGKVPVVVADGSGFVVNRILGPYLNEAGFLLESGASVEQIDRVAKEFGMPMGPLRLIDEIGIDIARHAGDALHAAFGDRMTPSPTLLALGGTSRLGRKGGLGFYRYEGDKELEVDPNIYSSLGFPSSDRKGLDPGDVTTRLVLSMVNEAARVLSDGIAASAADVDLAMIMGTGFPPFRGGLLRYADTIHLRTVKDRLEGLAERAGARFAPAPLIEELVEAESSFYAAFPSDAARVETTA